MDMRRLALLVMALWAVALIIYSSSFSGRATSRWRSSPSLTSTGAPQLPCEEDEAMQIMNAERQQEVQLLRNKLSTLESRVTSLDRRLKQKEQRKFLMFFPTDGPNNQLWGFKELLLYGDLTNRTAVLPHFLHHRRTGPGSIFPFSESYDAERFLQLTDSITMEDFAQTCKDELVIVYMRDRWKGWDEREARYREFVGLGEPLARHYPDHQKGRWQNLKHNPVFYSLDQASYFWEEHADARCLGIGFPYRNMQGTDMESVVALYSRFFRHSKEITDLADKVLEEVGIIEEDYYALHWRESEEGCQLEKDDAHVGFDMCFGTSGFNWAKSSDLIEVVQTEMEKYGLHSVYMATDSIEDQTLAKLKANLPHFRRSIDSPTLRNIPDNYHRSLVEQELMMRSRIFAGSHYSTWTTAVQQWWVAKPKNPNHVWSMEHLLKKYNKEVVLHNNSPGPPNGFIEVTYKEEAELTKLLARHTKPVPGGLAYTGDSHGDDKSQFSWTYSPLPTTSCTVVTYSRVAGERLDFARHLAQGGCVVHVVNPFLVPPTQNVNNLVFHRIPLDQYSYEVTLNIQDFIAKNNLGSIDLLVLNTGIERREDRALRILKGTIKDGSLKKVKQVIARLNFYPLYLEDEIHWAKSLAARASHWLDIFTGAEKSHQLQFVSQDRVGPSVQVVSWKLSE